MVTLVLGFLGTLAFVTGVAVLGSWLRQHPSRANAEKYSRIMHALFFGGLVAPTLVMVILGLIPAHVFFLKYFEQVELGLRFGESYARYRRKVPFLIPRSPAS